MDAAHNRNLLKADRVKNPDGELYKDAIDLCEQYKELPVIARYRNIGR